jgi:hypothetical protein
LLPLLQARIASIWSILAEFVGEVTVLIEKLIRSRTIDYFEGAIFALKDAFLTRKRAF